MEKENIMRFKTVCFMLFAFLLCRPSVAFPWGSVSPGAGTHQYIIATAYDRLKGDPAFETNLFPFFSAIKDHEGAQWTTGMSGFSLITLSGVGPDAKGMTDYSDHYYNPMTKAGNGPKAAADKYVYLATSNIVGKSSSEAAAKAAAWSAHFLADMFIPYHVVGMPRSLAKKIWDEQTAKHPGVINLGKNIYGSEKLSYLTPFKGGNLNFHTELSRFINQTNDDWFDPWYFNGNTDTMMINTSSHVAWEGTGKSRSILNIHNRAGQGVPGYDRRWINAAPSFNKPWISQANQVRQFAIQSAVESYGRLESYFEDPTPALMNTIQAVFTMWRSSFSGLRPSLTYKPDGPNAYKVIGKIDNYASAAATSVRVLLTAKDCTVSGQGEVAISDAIGPKGNSFTLPWRVETTDKLCKLTLQVVAAYPIPDLQYAQVEYTFFPKQISKTEPLKKPSIDGSWQIGKKGQLMEQFNFSGGSGVFYFGGSTEASSAKIPFTYRFDGSLLYIQCDSPVHAIFNRGPYKVNISGSTMTLRCESCTEDTYTFTKAK